MEALATVSEIPLFWSAPHTIPATGDETHGDQALPQRDPVGQSPWLLCCVRAHLLRHRGARPKAWIQPNLLEQPG